MRYLKYYRLREDLSQEELAKLVGIAQKQISYLENGKQSVSVYTLKRIAKALHFPHSELKLMDHVPYESK